MQSHITSRHGGPAKRGDEGAGGGGARPSSTTDAINLGELVDPELIFPDLQAFDSSTVLRALAERVADRGPVEDADELYRKLWEREQVGSTGIGHGVAVPHCKLEGLHQVLVAVAHVAKPIDFGAVDEKPVRLFFLVVSPESNPAAHLRCLQAISTWLKQSDKAERILELDDPETIHDLLSAR